MFDPKKLLDQLLSSQGASGPDALRQKAGQAVQMARDNPLAAGAIAAVLLGTGAGRNIAGSAIKLGGLAAIAGLGYQAYKNYQAGKAPGAEAPPADPAMLPPPSETGFHTDPAAAKPEFALVLVKAMIAAAAADGHIDDTERQRIVGKLGEAGLDAEAQAFIERELADPTGIDALVQAGATEEERVEIYTASRLAIDPDSRAERGYLDQLAGRLALPDPLIDHIEATVSGTPA